jgi:hypothetical protein
MENESNNSKLFRLLPELQQIAEEMKNVLEMTNKERMRILDKFKVKVAYDEGSYIVSVGKNRGSFDISDGDEDVEGITNEDIKRKIKEAGRAFIRNFNIYRDKLYAACEKRGWNIADEDECTFTISKDDLEIDIVENYKKYVVLSPVSDVEVGHVARYIIAREKNREAKK